MRKNKRAGAPRLDEIFVLVEVDVEIVEHGNLTTLVGAKIVVGHVDDDTKQIHNRAVFQRTSQILHDRNLNDLRDAKRCSQIVDRVVETTAGRVFQQQHIADDVGRAEEHRITNDANDWARETMNNARYPLELFLRVITVSLETQKIVNALPKLDILSA